MSDYEEQLYKVDSKFLAIGDNPLSFDVVYLNCNYKSEELLAVDDQYDSPSVYGYKSGSKLPTSSKEISVPYVLNTVSRTMLKTGTFLPMAYESITEKLLKQQLSWYDTFEGAMPTEFQCNPNLHRKLVATLNSKHSADVIFKMFVSEITTFLLDLNCGSMSDNLSLLNQLNISRRIRAQSSGKAFAYSVLALISPRVPVTGRLRKNREQVLLQKNDKFIVTTNRKYAMLGSKKVIYANCLYSMIDIKPDQYIHISEIVLRVIKSVRGSVECLIVRPGILRPLMRVIFPCNIMISQISVEEVQDITFAKGSEIDAIVLPHAGCTSYYGSIRNAMQLLQCNAHVFTVITQNEICNEEYANWVATTYDGIVLVVEKHLKPRQIIRFTKETRSFLQRCYDLKKLIIYSNFLPTQCGVNDVVTVSPKDHKHFFYYPDSFLLGSHEFSNLHIAIFDEIWHDIDARIERYAQEDLTAPFIDTSVTGSDTVARAVVRASYDINANAIIVCTVSGRMAEKIAHFRPRCPIIAVMKDTVGFKHLEVVHNVRLALYSESDRPGEQQLEIYKKLFFGILYGLTFGIFTINSNIIFGFRTIKNIGYPDKFISFRINARVINIIFQNLK